MTTSVNFKARDDIIPPKFRNDLEELPSAKFNSILPEFIERCATGEKYDVYEAKDILEPIEPPLQVNSMNSGLNFFSSNLEQIEDDEIKMQSEDEDKDDEEAPEAVAEPAPKSWDSWPSPETNPQRRPRKERLACGSPRRRRRRPRRSTIFSKR